MGASSQANEKSLALLLLPANPTPSNTVSTRLFHRDTDKEIKVLRSCEVHQRGGAKVYRCAIKAPRVTRTGTYGSCRSPKRGRIGLHLILCSIHYTATDRRCARSHSNTPPVKKLALAIHSAETDCNRIFRCLGNKVLRDEYHNNIVFTYSLNYDY